MQAAINDPTALPRVQEAMGLSLALPEQAGCRAPPAPGADGVDEVGEVVAGVTVSLVP